MNIGILLIMIIGGVAGIFSTLYLTVSIPVVLGWKIYRRFAKGIPLTKYLRVSGQSSLSCFRKYFQKIIQEILSHDLSDRLL